MMDKTGKKHQNKNAKQFLVFFVTLLVSSALVIKQTNDRLLNIFHDVGRCVPARASAIAFPRKAWIQYNTIQYNTIQYNTIQCSTMLYMPMPYDTVQYNTIQYNTIQYNTIQ